MADEITGIQEVSQPTQETSFQDHQNYLVSESKDALTKSVTFEQRNDRMAKAVAKGDALLAANSIGKPEMADAIEAAMIVADKEAGEVFASSFDIAGIPLKDQTEAYTKAMNAGGEIALRHLPKVLESAGINIDATALLNKADFTAVLRLTAKQLGKDFPQGFTQEQIIAVLSDIVPADDYFRDQVNTLPFNHDSSLSDTEVQGLDIAIRDANGTWKAAQVHRAAWESYEPGKGFKAEGSRIDPQKREVFNPYDLLKQTQYDRLIAQGRTPDQALLGVGFEVYKDLYELKKALPKAPEIPTPANQ